MIKLTKWDVLALLLLLIGIMLLLASSGTSDVKSITSEDPGLASDRTLLLLAIAGCISALAGIAVLIRKGGK